MKTMDPSTSTFPCGGGRGSAFLTGLWILAQLRFLPGKWDQFAARGAPLWSTSLMEPVTLRPDFITRQLRRLPKRK